MQRSCRLAAAVPGDVMQVLTMMMRMMTLQIMLSLICPLLIPWLITFDRSSGMRLFHNRVAPLNSKDAAKEERLITRAKRQIVRSCSWFICSRVLVLLLYSGRLFYKAPVVKFCCHTVTTLCTCTDLLLSDMKSHRVRAPLIAQLTCNNRLKSSVNSLVQTPLLV